MRSKTVLNKIGDGDVRKLFHITFSPTGTSKKVAEQIAQAFDCAEMTLDLCKAWTEDVQLKQDDICIFSVPCYGGRVPQTAAERLSHIHGAGTPAIVCVTFGNRAFEDALLELADCVAANGFQVIAGCAAAAEHNIMHIFGQGRPDALDREEIQQFSNRVAQKVKSGQTTRPVLPGHYPYKERHMAKTPILVDEKTCVSCGICAAACPVQAISADGRHHSEDVCIGCMRCIKICPNKSKTISNEYVTALIQRVGSACEGRKANEFYL